MPHWTAEDYANYNARRGISVAIPESVVCNDPLATARLKAKDTGKFIVHVVSRRRRLIDVDNLVAKYHVDALRYAGILPSDAPDQTDIKISQIKVPTKNDEFTSITIERL